MEFFDFGAEPDATVAIGFVADMDHAGEAPSVFGFAAGDFGRQAKSGFDGHTYLQRGRRGEKEAASRNVHGLSEMLTAIGGEIHGAKTQRSAVIEAGKLASFGGSHIVRSSVRGALQGPIEGPLG